MTYRLTILPAAARQLKDIPLQFRKQIDARILALAEEPRPSGCKVLKGGKRGLYRIRSGNFRVIYQINDEEVLVTVVKVGDRRDVYE